MQSTFKQQIAAIKYVLAGHGFSKSTQAELNDAMSTIAGWVFLQTVIKARISEIKKDGRLIRGVYPAHIQSNAPLAMIQVGLVSELRALEQIVGAKKTRLPIWSKHSSKRG